MLFNLLINYCVLKELISSYHKYKKIQLILNNLFKHKCRSANFVQKNWIATLVLLIHC